MTENAEPYNPLDKHHLAESIAREFFKGALHPLPPATTFTGAGIYAIYYGGSYPLYADIAASLKKYESACSKQPVPPGIKQPRPIYIGKSDPPGSRKGVLAAASDEEIQELLVSKPKHTKLWARLKKHSASILATKNLKIEDFKCRYMLVDEIWVALGEARLVALFTPVWNVFIEGFGSNVEGGGRERTARSVWDILHPGRKDSLAIQVDPAQEAGIVNSLRSAKTVSELKAAVKVHRDAKRQFAEARKKVRGGHGLAGEDSLDAETI